jgi:pilus assembly protein CpaB
VTRRRRAVLLLGLALLLGALAAADVLRREAALREQLGPQVDVVVAREPLEAGRRVKASDLAVQPVPERYAPGGGPGVPDLLVGERLAVPVPRGAPVTEYQLASQQAVPRPAVRGGERAIEVLASATPELVTEGARVDVVITRERSEGRGTTALALEDVEVLAARPANADDEGRGRGVAATLRVRAVDAVYLAAAASFARDIRLLARPAGDAKSVGPVAFGSGLEAVPALR